MVIKIIQTIYFVSNFKIYVFVYVQLRYTNIEHNICMNSIILTFYKNNMRPIIITIMIVTTNTFILYSI